jgi:hypothetical protein
VYYSTVTMTSRWWTSGAAATVVTLGIATAACGVDIDTAPAVATPHVRLSKADVMVGGPVEMTYTFSVAASAPPFPDDCAVFVHFSDVDGEPLWGDDHQPSTPTQQWKPGDVIEYTRTVFVPRIPYVGETRVEIGIVTPSGERLPLSAPVAGPRVYAVASLNLDLQPDGLFVVFREGWHLAERSDDGLRDWHWSAAEATLVFRNPRQDVLWYLDLERAGGFPGPQQVELRIGDAVIDAFSLSPSGADLRKIPLTADQLGSGETVEVRLSVDRTFVPALVAGSGNGDSRELGVKVFRAFVEPIP